MTPPSSKINKKWQPIESAPRDGTEILIVVPYCLVSVRCSFTVMYIAQFGTNLLTFEGCWSAVGDEQFMPYEPSHWMPLPVFP